MLTSTSGPSLQSSVQTDSTLNGAGFINPAVNVLSAPGAHAKGGGLKTTTKDQAIQHLGLANKQNTKDRKNTGRRAPHETPAPSPGKAHQAKTLKTNLQGNMIWCFDSDDFGSTVASHSCCVETSLSRSTSYSRLARVWTQTTCG